MATILDVAKYIAEKSESISAWKLQKLCYYSQAWSLAWDGVPIFEQDFEAWANGPVCPDLFRLHRKRFLVDKSTFPQMCGKHNLTENEIDTINKVFDFYGSKEDHWLSELVKKERPWKEARWNGHALPGDVCAEIISKNSMYDYYSGLE